ncbi:MAG: hypothetical protein NTW87_28405 [Planctomycetota bacterium]|nr:hypothetical protein [Planctomycetota bacterium]
MRFVVLHHTDWLGHADHYDLLLQLDAGTSDDDPVLKAFATPADEFPLVSRDPADRVATQSVTLHRLPDHRRIYLWYEGPVSGNRGRVTRVDEGELTLLRPPDAAVREIQTLLAGGKLSGSFRLTLVGEGVYSFAGSTPPRR